MIIKMTEDSDIYKNEVDTLRKMQQKTGQANIPELKQVGTISHEEKEIHYLTMPNYGKNLLEFLDDIEPGVSKISIILDIMQQLINSIEYVHFKGFTHNDIKPQNIMIGGNQTVTLVDFGAADSISNRS